MPNNGKTYQYSAVRGGKTIAKAAPKATVDPSTTIHLGPRTASSGVDDSMVAARLPREFVQFVHIRGLTLSDRNRSRVCRTVQWILNDVLI